MSLSVILAVFNEEENIGPCLETVKGIADEIVVVDGGSTDKTVEIAKNYTSKITITNNPSIFHINKQKALDLATGDWVLQLDADERVDSLLANEIKIVTQKPQIINGYYLNRKNFFLGSWLKKGGQYPDPVIRLMRKNKGKFPCKSVHEQIVVEGEIGTLNNDLLHYTAPTFSRYLTNSNRYTSLTAVEFKEQNIDTGFASSLRYVFFEPFKIFLSLFFRHKGILDGFPGFVFAMYSGLHIRTSYIKYWESVNKK